MACNCIRTFANPIVFNESITLEKGITTNKTNGNITLGNALTLNGYSGIITFTLIDVAANLSVSTSVSNTFVGSSNIILSNIIGFSDAYRTNGIPVVSIGNIASGSFDVIVSNVHRSNAFTAGHTLKIGYLVT